MKRWFPITMVFVLLTVFASPVSAASQQPYQGPRGIFSLVGRIASIDSAAGTVTIDVLRGNFLVKNYIGGQLTVNTSASTRYLYKSSPTAIPVTILFADLKVSDAVSVNGVLAGNVWTASRITVGARLVHFP